MFMYVCIWLYLKFQLCCVQDTILVIPPYPYCIEEVSHNVLLEDCWYACLQLLFTCYLLPKGGRPQRRGSTAAALMTSPPVLLQHLWGAEISHQLADGECWGDQVVWALPNFMPVYGSGPDGKLIRPDGKWSVVVKPYRRVCTMYIQICCLTCMYILHTHIYGYECVYTKYIHIIKFIYVYVHTTYIYVLLCTCTNMGIHVHECMNMYVHVSIMFRHVYTVLQYPVHEGRILDDWYVHSVLLVRTH